MIREDPGKKGLLDAAGKSITPKAAAVLVATKSAAEQEQKLQNEAVKKLLRGEKGEIRVLTVPDLSALKKGEGWNLMEDVIRTAVSMTALTSESIDKKDSVARNFKMLMEQLTDA